MRHKLAVWLPLSVLSAALSLGCSAQQEPAPDAAPRGPDFELASLDGRMVSSSSFAGKVVLLEFWATWCTPCVAQARILEPLHRDFADRGVEFVAINIGEDATTVAKYVERTPFPYPVLLDPQDELSARVGIYALPTVMILDAAGRIAFYEPGLSSGEVLRRVLEQTIG